MSIGSILILILIGLIAGALARFLVPGKDPMGLIGTAILGIIGSFVGGSLWALIAGGEFQIRSASFVGSVIGAVIALLVYRAVASRA